MSISLAAFLWIPVLTPFFFILDLLVQWHFQWGPGISDLNRKIASLKMEFILLLNILICRWCCMKRSLYHLRLWHHFICFLLHLRINIFHNFNTVHGFSIFCLHVHIFLGMRWFVYLLLLYILLRRQAEGVELIQTKREGYGESSVWLSVMFKREFINVRDISFLHR